MGALSGVPGRLWRATGGRAAAWWSASPWNRAVLLAILVYGIAFSVLTCLRVLGLSAFAFDLGLYDQAMYTTVTGHGIFEIVGPGQIATRSFFATHFSPFLFLLLLPYAVAPSPLTLVVLQTWAIAFAALPVYLLARHFLRYEGIAFAFGLIFLLHPATQGVNWFDFHLEAFLLLTMGTALYLYERRSWRAFFVAALVTLSVLEVAGILLLVVALGALAAETWGRTVEGKPWDREKNRVLLATAGLSLAWLGIAYAVMRSAAATGFVDVNPDSWALLGSPSLIGVPGTALLHPDRAIAALAYDATAKAWYLIVLFLPLQLFTLRSPRATLYCLPWLGPALLSGYPPFYQIGDQYPALVLPFLFYGAIVGLARPFAWPTRLPSILARFRALLKQGEGLRGIARAMLATTVVLLIVTSPLGPWALGSYTPSEGWVVTAHDRAVLELLHEIPPDASVVTQNDLYPLLSGRTGIWMIPVNLIFPAGGSFNGTLASLLGNADYILVDLAEGFVEASLIFSSPDVAANFSLVGAADGAVLFERGVHPLRFFLPWSRTADYDAVLPLNATIRTDPATASGYALEHLNLTTSHFWFGPFWMLPPGRYNVSYRISVDRVAVGPLLGLPVNFHPMRIDAQTVTSPNGRSQTFFTPVQDTNLTAVALLQVNGSDDPAAGEYFVVTQTFDVRALGLYEFPGYGASGAIVMRFDELTVAQSLAYPAAAVSITWS
jgi:uncharacterized membrane protein